MSATEGTKVNIPFKVLRCRGLHCDQLSGGTNPRVLEPELVFCCPLRVEISLQFSSQNAQEVEGEDLRPSVSLFPCSDSAVELWEADTQDASSQALGASSCTLGEEASLPQAAGGTLGTALEAAEPTALFPGVEASPESTGEELLDVEEVGASWAWEGYLGALYFLRS